MTRKFSNIVLAAGLALASIGSLTACKTIVPNVVTSPVAAVTKADEKALIASEAFFEAASVAINKAIDAGILKGDKALQVQVIYRNARATLARAREFQHSLNHDGLVGEVMSANNMLTQILGLLK